MTRQEYTTEPTSYNFGDIRTGQVKTKTIALRNNYLTPSATTYTVDAPFAIDGVTSKSITNEMTEQIAVDCDMMLHINNYDDDILMVYNYDGNLMLKINDNSAITIDSNVYDGAVVFKSSYVSGIPFYLGYAWRNNTIYTFYRYGSTTTIAATEITGGTVTTVNEIIGCESIETYRDGESFLTLNVTSIRVNTTNLVHCVYGHIGSHAIGSYTFVTDWTGDAIWDIQARSMFGLREFINPISGVTSYVMSVLCNNERIYTLKLEGGINVEVYRDVASSGTSPKVSQGYYDANDDGDYIIVGQLDETSMSIHRAEKTKYDYKKVIGSSSDSILYRMDINTNDSWVETALTIEAELLSDLVIEFCNYVSGVLTVVDTVTITHGGSMGEFVDYSTIKTNQAVARYVRLSGTAGMLDAFSVGAFSLTGTSGSVLLMLDGFEVVVGDIISESDNEICGYIPLKAGVTAYYTPTDELQSLEMLKNSILTFRNESSDDKPLWNDDAIRLNLYSYISTNIDLHAQHAYQYGSVQYLALYKTNKLFITALDSTLDRIDDSVDAIISVSPTVAGYLTDDIEYSSYTTALIANALTELNLASAPYGVVIFGQGHTDFQRISKTPVTKTITYYASLNTTSTKHYNVDECIIDTTGVTMSAYPVSVEAESVAYADSSDWYDSFVETINVMYDPFMQSMMVNDSTILCMVSTAISKHPTIIDWTLDGNYIMNENIGYYKNGDRAETSDMTDADIPLLVAGSRQIVVNEVVINDSHPAGGIRVKVAVSKVRWDEDGDNEETIYDDFKVFFVQLMPSGLIDVIGDMINA